MTRATSDNKLMCYPQQLGRSWKVFGYLPRNLPRPHQPSAPEPSGTSSATCTRTLQDLISNLHRTTRALRKAICTGNHWNLPEPRQASAPEPSGTSSAICTGILRLITYLHRKAPEPSGTWCCSCTGPHQSYSGLG